MPDSSTNPDEPKPQRKHQEYEDPHYHDDDVEAAPAADADQRGSRPSARRRPNRRPSPRHHYHED